MESPHRDYTDELAALVTAARREYVLTAVRAAEPRAGRPTGPVVAPADVRPSHVPATVDKDDLFTASQYRRVMKALFGIRRRVEAVCADRKIEMTRELLEHAIPCHAHHDTREDPTMRELLVRFLGHATSLRGTPLYLADDARAQRRLDACPQVFTMTYTYLTDPSVDRTVLENFVRGSMNAESDQWFVAYAKSKGLLMQRDMQYTRVPEEMRGFYASIGATSDEYATAMQTLGENHESKGAAPM